MGRIRINENEKKSKLSITISSENYEQMVDSDINKSKLINWLLEQHFNNINL